MKIALTGASGYVGGAIASAFRERGHEVFSLSRRPCLPPWQHYSLGDDPNSISWENVQVLIHAAHDFTAATPSDNHTRNIAPAIDLFNTAHSSGVSHLVFISSMSSFENCTSEYGKAKLSIEQQISHLNPTLVRPGLVWGGDTGGVMAALEATVLHLPIVPFITGGNTLNQYLVHAEDLATKLANIIDSQPPTKAQIIASYHPQPLSLFNILKILAVRHAKKRLFIPIHWRFAMLGLNILEALRIRLPFRSDSLKGLVFANQSPPFPENPSCYRKFC